jgi:hypothetical protein
VEDRITPSLYLELTDRAVDDYADRRVPEVLAQPGVSRATWWTNCKPSRDDLPRTLDEFALLGVYEADGDFVPPRAGSAGLPGDIRGLHFVHHRRPGQGTLSVSATVGLLLVLISPRHDDEAQALRDWADFVHIRDIAAASPPHFTMITPYESADGGQPRFLHFYELDTDDPEPAFQQMTPATFARVGAYGTHARREWIDHEALVIDYVNTFRRRGERLSRE